MFNSPLHAPSRAQWVTAVVAMMLFMVAATTPVAAAQHNDDRAFIVALDTDGSATVTVQLAYDLNAAEEREAFQQLRRDEAYQTQYRSRFTYRMQRVAASAADTTGRDMSVSNTRIAFETRDNGATGVVSLSIDWDGLAATTDEGLIVTEPFASGFEVDRRFVLRGPDGYRVADVSPAPDSENDSVATWKDEASLDGFHATFVPAEPASQGGPGFGMGVAIVGLLLFAGLAWRHHTHR